MYMFVLLIFLYIMFVQQCCTFETLIFVCIINWLNQNYLNLHYLLLSIRCLSEEWGTCTKGFFKIHCFNPSQTRKNPSNIHVIYKERKKIHCPLWSALHCSKAVSEVVSKHPWSHCKELLDFATIYGCCYWLTTHHIFQSYLLWILLVIWANAEAPNQKPFEK